MPDFSIKLKKNAARDLVSLGEVLLRFDAGEERIHTAREFRVWDGGGEYNVAKNLSRIFRRRTAVATVLADNALGQLAADFAGQGGVDTSLIVWREAENSRNGLYFIERGFGIRPPSSCFDRSQTAISALRPGEIDWQEIFYDDGGTRWFHTGGIFAGLSETTPEAAREAMEAARDSGAIVSYDLNYRDSLWKARGGRAAANRVNRQLLPFADVVIGIPDYLPRFTDFNATVFLEASEELLGEFPNLKIIAVTLREVISASCHSFSAACYAGGTVFRAREYKKNDVLDRVGSGDAFAAGFIEGLLNQKGLQTAVETGAACAVLTMTTPGDNSMATRKEVEQLMKGADAAAIR